MNLWRRKRVVERVKMNPSLYEGILLVVMREYCCRDVPGILCTACLVKVGSNRDGAEKGDWDGKATEREMGNTGYALYIETNLCQYFPVREKTHLNLKPKPNPSRISKIKKKWILTDQE